MSITVKSQLVRAKQIGEQAKIPVFHFLDDEA